MLRVQPVKLGGLLLSLCGPIVQLRLRPVNHLRARIAASCIVDRVQPRRRGMTMRPSGAGRRTRRALICPLRSLRTRKHEPIIRRLATACIRCYCGGAE